MERTPDDAHIAALHRAWSEYGDPAQVLEVLEVSANVSTNRVYRLALSDGRHVIAKVSSYGSYFLFAEDHDRLHRVHELLRGTRFGGFLAAVLDRDGRAYTWYDGTLWAAFYEEIERRDALPRILDDDQIDTFGREIAEFHLACATAATHIPPTSNTVKGDAITLLDQLSSPFAPRNFDLPPEYVGVLWRHTHEFLLELERIRYDEWPSSRC
ncbi:MAG: hypothetical protein R2715_10070 [Ilumatobacteraceae bacterium]